MGEAKARKEAGDIPGPKIFTEEQANDIYQSLRLRKGLTNEQKRGVRRVLRKFEASPQFDKEVEIFVCDGCGRIVTGFEVNGKIEIDLSGTEADVIFERYVTFALEGGEEKKTPSIIREDFLEKVARILGPEYEKTFENKVAEGMPEFDEKKEDKADAGASEHPESDPGAGAEATPAPAGETG